MKPYIVLFDTSFSSDNLGDSIIMENVDRTIREAFPESFIYRIATHGNIGEKNKAWLGKASLSVVGGTNILCQLSNKRALWSLSNQDVKLLNNKIVLLGAGWNRYSLKLTRKSAKWWNKILSNDYLHSVRDNFTKDALASYGIKNVINTGCPTLWHLPQDENFYRKDKADSVLFTLTSHKPNYNRDGNLVKTCIQLYSNIYFWPQDIRDAQYLASILSQLEIPSERIQHIDPNLKAYDLFLSSTETDYLGTRLHGGIHAMKYGHRVIIIGIDNRAVEMQRANHLNVYNIQGNDELSRLCKSTINTALQIDYEAINKWKEQFNRYGEA